MKVENKVRDTLEAPTEFALCSLQFRFALRVLCFIVETPSAKKTLNPTNVWFRLKSRAVVLNPPAGPLRRFDRFELLQLFLLFFEF